MAHNELTKAGGPAFPVSIPGCGDNGWQGMSLRDYFAAQYMADAMERAPHVSDAALADMNLHTKKGGVRREEVAAVLSYRMADAMLAARKVST